nr:TonB-dependent receptor [Anaerovibrio lipolyticus]
MGARETWTTGAITNYSNFSMSGQWLHKMNDENSLYLSVAQSFIMPTFAEMYRSGDQAVPNPNLKPQKGMNYEVGWKQNHGDHSWKAALFYAHIKDNISSKYDKTNKIYTYTNDEYKNMGVELSYDYSPEGKFAYNCGLTYMNPLTRSKGSVKDYWDRKFGKIQITGGITYKIGKFTTNFNASYLADRVMCPSTSHSYPTKPYLLTSMNFLYSPDKNSEISLEIDNVLNRHDNVMHTSSDYYTPPTNFMLSYNYKF